MIDDNGHARLIDFGLAHFIDDDEVVRAAIAPAASSIRWCALELLEPECHGTTKASDVYAFGSTVFEVHTSFYLFAFLYTKHPTRAAPSRFRPVRQPLGPRRLLRDHPRDHPPHAGPLCSASVCYSAL